LLALGGVSAASAQTRYYEVSEPPQVINHFDTVSFMYHCPNGDMASDGAGNIATNTSSPNVTMAQFRNYDGSVQISFTNWNLDGDQTYSFNILCMTDRPLEVTAPTPDPSPVPAPQPQPQPQAPVQAPLAGLSLTDFQAAYNGLLTSLPTAQRKALPALTPAPQSGTRNPNTHLIQLYTPPQTINYLQTLTLNAACPAGGQVVQDPTNHLAVPYVPRASATNLFNTLVGGGSNEGGIAVNFSSEERAQQIVAFEYTCLMPGPAQADAAPLMTLTPRRSSW
jgi:hypothetical protein